MEEGCPVLSLWVGMCRGNSCPAAPHCPQCCAWTSDVLLKLCATNEHLPAPAPPAPLLSPFSGHRCTSQAGALPLCRHAVVSWEGRQCKPVAGILGSLAWCRRGSACMALMLVPAPGLSVTGACLTFFATISRSLICLSS